jgi:hypothetical protein
MTATNANVTELTATLKVWGLSSSWTISSHPLNYMMIYLLQQAKP